MPMTSCDLVVDFAAPLSFAQSLLIGKNRIYIDLTWAEPTQMLAHFKLHPRTAVEQGLLWLEGTIELSALLDYHGHTLEAAAAKFSQLAEQLQWRQGPTDKCCLDGQQVEAFYRELQAGNRPLDISLAFIEHC
jgi:hypothetical protein